MINQYFQLPNKFYSPSPKTQENKRGKYWGITCSAARPPSVMQVNIKELLLGHQKIFIRNILCKSQRCSTTWNNRYLKQRLRMFQEPTSSCMTRFMVCNSLPFKLANNLQMKR